MNQSGREAASLIAAALLIASVLCAAQGASKPPMARADLMRPVPLRTGIGHASDPATTQHPDALRYYDQGVAYLHSYVWVEAARSFNEALRLDADMAVAYVGLSYAHVELNDPAAAREAISKAEALAPHASARERLRIELRVKQMTAEDRPGDKALFAEYRTVLDGALAKYPKDVELLLLRGMAESGDPAERGQGSPPSSAPFYLKALALAPEDDAPHHFLIHAYENGGREADALKEASRYAAMAPAVPHAHHMLGHVLQRQAQMSGAIAAFEAADRLERTYLRDEMVPAVDDWHFEHNLDLLGGAYAYVGRMHKAESTLGEAFGLPTYLVEEGFNKRNWPEFLIDSGRSREAAAASEALTGYSSALVTATGHIERAKALMALHEFGDAASEGNAALRDMRRAPDGAALVAPAFAAMQGEFLLRTNEPERGRQMLEDFARKLRAAPGPDTWIDGLFALEHIASAARDAGRWDVARWAAGEMHAYDPAYGGTHFAAALNAQHDGNTARARSEFAAAARAWAAGDQDVPALVRARKESQ